MYPINEDYELKRKLLSMRVTSRHEKRTHNRKVEVETLATQGWRGVEPKYSENLPPIDSGLGISRGPDLKRESPPSRVRLLLSAQDLRPRRQTMPPKAAPGRGGMRGRGRGRGGAAAGRAAAAAAAAAPPEGEGAEVKPPVAQMVDP